jgi:GAF domain-containing protein
MVVGLPLADELAAVFARANDLLLTEETVSRALELIAAAARAAIPGAVGAGVTLVDTEGRKRTAAASDPVVEAADDWQYILEEGPCLQAWASGEPVLVKDVLTDTRWPAWSEAADKLGVGSSVSAPLRAGDSVLGAVKVYARDAGRFDPSTVALMELFAAQATIFIVNVQARESAQSLSEMLQEALAGREIIAAARGVLMARHGVDEASAMQLLLTESRRNRKPVRDISAEVVSSTRIAGR